MTLVYGPLSDAFGRCNVVLVSVVIYVAASVGCAAAPSFEWRLAMRIGEGLAASGGLVVGRAIIPDAFAGAQAQRVMSQAMLIFALAPAVAPILGGYLHEFYGWRSVFWFLALLGLGVWVGVARGLAETLPPVARQSPHPRAIAQAYARVLTHGRFMLLVLITAFGFAGFFLYIAGSPDIIMYRHLHYGADEFGVERRVAGVLAPALSLTRPGLATGMLALNAIGLIAWLGYQRMPGAVPAHAP